MLNRARSRVHALRRLVTLSPQIAALIVFTVVVVIAMLIVGIAVIGQSTAAGTVTGYNNADVNRSFVQLQRETLRLIAVVRSAPAEFDLKAIELQRNLVESRIVVVNYKLVQDSLPAESVEASRQITATWQQIKPLLDQWEADLG